MHRQPVYCFLYLWEDCIKQNTHEQDTRLFVSLQESGKCLMYDAGNSDHWETGGGRKRCVWMADVSVTACLCSAWWFSLQAQFHPSSWNKSESTSITQIYSMKSTKAEVNHSLAPENYIQRSCRAVLLVINILLDFPRMHFCLQYCCIALCYINDVTKYKYIICSEEITWSNKIKKIHRFGYEIWSRSILDMGNYSMRCSKNLVSRRFLFFMQM